MILIISPGLRTLAAAVAVCALAAPAHASNQDLPRLGFSAADGGFPARLPGLGLHAPARADFAFPGTPALRTAAAPGERRPPEAQSSGDPTPEQLRWRNAAIAGGAAGLVATYGANKWWQDGFRGRLGTVSEGWFSQGTEYGGADKLGHAFFSYVGTRLLTTAFKAAGNGAERSVDLGALWSLGIMTGVEVLDGYSKKYRFSTEDAVMNVLGAAAGYLMERNPALDALVDLRLHYVPSDKSNFNIGGDYSGQTYILAFKASGMPAFRDNGLLRLLEFSVGYGTRGYESPPPIERRRQLYFGITLNMSELLGRTLFRGNARPSPAQRATDLFFECIQLPGTAAPLAKHRF